MDEEETSTCSKCGLGLDYYELVDVYYDVCANKECANYGLFQVPLEKMEKGIL